MRGKQAFADPVRKASRQPGRQSDLLYASEARWPAASKCSAPAITRENRREGYRERDRYKARRDSPSSSPRSSSHGNTMLDN